MTKGKKEESHSLWTPEEVAKYWRVRVSTVYRLIRQDRINAICVGRSYRIPEQQVLTGLPRDWNRI